ncbi:MAG: aromatic ring-hydroxylating dioxygenase subunit alpha [Proteobacteria bacterium]|nr:aromatic ring-hydroxylating dioxygenase subunit alpha [Pseudomonadota bacterium]
MALATHHLRALRQALPELNRSPETARGLPAFVYADPEWFAAERRDLFADGWMAVAFESDVSAAGDAAPIAIAGWSFLATRAEDGRVRVFHNICSHRGMRLLDAAKRECATLSCPWHGWTYDLAGRLAATPRLGGLGTTTQDGFDPERHGLRPVRAESWLGVVFVNINGTARPLAEHARSFADRMAAFDYGATEQSDLACEFDYACNWKVAVEGGIEDYHVPLVHGQIGPARPSHPELGGDAYVGIMSKRPVDVARRRFVGGAPGEIAPLPTFPHVPDSGEVEATTILLLFPNLYVATMLDHVTLTIIAPQSVAQTRLRRRFRFVRPAATTPAFASPRQRVVDSWMTITNQDAPLWAELQTLMAVRAELGFRACFSRHWETAVHHFQCMVARKMLAAADRELAAMRRA